MLLFSCNTSTIRLTDVRAMMIMTRTMESCMILESICEAYMIRTVRSPSPTGLPPTVRSAAKRKIMRKENHMQNCMTGVLIAIRRSPSVKSFATSAEVFSNFCFSKSSRTKDLTTRIPLISSRIERFMLSYFLNTRSKMGKHFKITAVSTPARMGMSATNTHEMVTLTVNAIAREKASMSGQRMATRMIIIYAICTFVTSVVRRVTRLEVENLSILEKE